MLLVAMEDTAKAMEEMTKVMKEMAVSMDDLKGTVKNLTEQNESLLTEMKTLQGDNDFLKTEMKTLGKLKKDNAFLKKEIPAMRFELFTMLQRASPPSHQQQQQQQQQHQEKDQVAVFTPTFPFKWGSLSMVTDKEKKDLKFFMQTRTFSSCNYEFDKSFYRHSFCGFTRPDEIRFEEEDADNGITNTGIGSFTAPMFGRYRFDVKGNMRAYGNTSAIAKWYICCIRKEDDIFDEDNPENKEYNDNKDNREAREKVFLQERKKHLLFTVDNETDSDETKEISIAVDCDKDVRFWIEVEIENGDIDDIADSRYCIFNGHFIR